MNWLDKLLRVWGRPLRFFTKQKPDERTLRWSGIKQKRLHCLAFGDPNESGKTKILKRENSLPKKARWIFRVLNGVDQGREYIAITKEIPVGRHPDNLILLRDPKVSRFHAAFHYNGSRLFLEDLGSTNGTRVNGEIIFKKKMVSSGDEIKIGETIIQVILEKD